MSIEATKLIEFLGYDPKTIDSEEKFKELVEKDYIKRDEAVRDEAIVNTVTGKRIGALETAFKKSLKSVGVEFENAELKDKKIEDYFTIAATKVSARIKEFEGKVSQTNDEAVKEWQDKYSKLEAKANDYKKSWESTQTEFDGFKTAAEEEKKTGKVKQYEQSAWAAYKWPAGIDELKKEGFVSYINKNYKIQLDETGQPFATDKDGNRIKSGKTHGAFKSLEEILIEEGTAKQVYAVTQAQGGFIADRIKQVKQEAEKQQQNISGRRIHPSAVKAI